VERLGRLVTDRAIGWKTGHASSGTKRMLASIILAAAIPVLLFGGWAAYLTAERGREEARRTAFETAKRVADHVAAELDQELDIARALVASGFPVSKTGSSSARGTSPAAAISRAA
jgi:hypothetical protein